jgi:acyl-CoA dehydrogenase
LYAANMPAEVGGAGLDTVTWVLYEKELGRTSYALHYSCVGRPSNILLACEGEQRERYLLPTVRGERTECLAMTEPGAGSDLRGMKTTAVEKRRRFRHQRHQALHQPRRSRGLRDSVRRHRRGEHPARQAQAHHRVLVDMGTPGSRCARLQERLAPRLHQQHSAIQRLPRAEERHARRVHQGFEVANTWLGATRLQVAATCLGRAERALELAKQWAVDRVQFGQQIGKFQGVSFKLADMAVELRAAELLTLEAAWKLDQKIGHRHGHGDRQSSRPPKCWPWWPMRRCRFTAAWA